MIIKGDCIEEMKRKKNILKYVKQELNLLLNSIEVLSSNAKK